MIDLPPQSPFPLFVIRKEQYDGKRPPHLPDATLQSVPVFSQFVLSPSLSPKIHAIFYQRLLLLPEVDDTCMWHIIAFHRTRLYALEFCQHYIWRGMFNLIGWVKSDESEKVRFRISHNISYIILYTFWYIFDNFSLSGTHNKHNKNIVGVFLYFEAHGFCTGT